MSTRWPLISGALPLKSDRDIGKHNRWSFVMGAAEDRFYCTHKRLLAIVKFYNRRIALATSTIGFGCFGGIFGGCSAPGRVYFMTCPIYNVVPFRGARVSRNDSTLSKHGTNCQLHPHYIMHIITMIRRHKIVNVPIIWKNVLLNSPVLQHRTSCSLPIH